MFLRFQAFLKSFKMQNGPTKNIKKPMFLFRFLGIQEFLESFECQDCLTKNIKNQMFFKVFGVSGLSRELQEPRRPHQKHWKINGFSRFLGFQAFPESFHCLCELYVSKITKSQKTEPRLKIHKVPENIFHTSKFYKVPEIARASLPSPPISLWALPLCEFFSLCVVYLSVSFTSLCGL